MKIILLKASLFTEDDMNLVIDMFNGNGWSGTFMVLMVEIKNNIEIYNIPKE